jgi:Fe2+ transport system protein B
MKIKDKKESIIVDITKYMKAKEEEKRKNQLIDTIAGLGLMAIVIFILVWWSIFAFIFNAISM